MPRHRKKADIEQNKPAAKRFDNKLQKLEILWQTIETCFFGNANISYVYGLNCLLFSLFVCLCFVFFLAQQRALSSKNGVGVAARLWIHKPIETSFAWFPKLQISFYRPTTCINISAKLIIIIIIFCKHSVCAWIFRVAIFFFALELLLLLSFFSLFLSSDRISWALILIFQQLSFGFFQWVFSFRWELVPREENDVHVAYNRKPVSFWACVLTLSHFWKMYVFRCLYRYV